MKLCFCYWLYWSGRDVVAGRPGRAKQTPTHVAGETGRTLCGRAIPGGATYLPGGTTLEAVQICYSCHYQLLQTGRLAARAAP